MTHFEKGCKGGSFGFRRKKGLWIWVLFEFLNFVNEIGEEEERGTLTNKR